MSSNKKKLTEDQEDQNSRAIDGLNDDLRRYLIRLGWNNPKVRNEFISVINSYILSGENTSVQRMITTYLNKGLDVLNIELNKKDIIDKQSVTRVDAEDVDRDNNISENLKHALRRNKVKKQKKVATVRNISELRKGLIDRGLNLVESGKILQEGLRYKNQKSYYSDIKALIKENDDVEDQKEDVYINNFKTFLKLYLENEYNWVTDSLKSLIQSILSLIDKGSNSKKTQTEIDLKIEDLVKLISNNLGGFDGTPEPTKNFEVASSEIRKYAVINKNWKSSEFASMFNNIMKLAVNSKNVNVQRKITQKISEIESSIVKKEPKEDKQSNDKTNDNEEQNTEE